jgi:FkbM family methyltransferase
MGSFRHRIGGLIQPIRRLVSQPSLAESSYSGAGEDRFVLAWLQVVYGLDIGKVRYCDIGANHPRTLNNTFALYLRGASGVLVEPDPDLVHILKQGRPRDTVLNVGVAFDDQRSARLKRLSSNVFNTFLQSHADMVSVSSKNWQPHQRQNVRDEVEIRLVPANDILSKHFADGIDFISIDAEGVDFPVLQSIDFKRFRPKMLCVEASRAPTEFDAVLNPCGYELIGRTPDNLLYRLAG